MSQLRISMACAEVDSILYLMCTKQCKKFLYVFAYTFVNILKFILVDFPLIIFLTITALLIFSHVTLSDSRFKGFQRLNNNFRRMFSTESIKIFDPISDFLKLKFNVHKKKYADVFSLICSFNNLFNAWSNIKSKSINVTLCSDDKKLFFDKVDRDWFVSLRKKLFNGSHNYKPARKAFISKSNKSGKNHLIIGSFQDKVIQQAFLQVLQQIYEGVFV